MLLIVVLVLLVLFAGGGWGYRQYGASSGPYLGGGLGVLVIVLVLFWALGVLR